MIDIGGPAMVRAAAKNHAHVGVVVDPAEYGEVLDELAPARARCRTRRGAAWPARPSPTPPHTTPPSSPGSTRAMGDALPPTLAPRAGADRSALRYGENPHQRGARYRVVGTRRWWDDVRQHSGMALSYLNFYDADAAWRLVHELFGPERRAVGHRQARQPVRRGRRGRPAPRPTSGPSSATRCRRSAASSPSTALSTRRWPSEMVAGPQADVLIAPAYEDGDAGRARRQAQEHAPARGARRPSRRCATCARSAAGCWCRSRTASRRPRRVAGRDEGRSPTERAVARRRAGVAGVRPRQVQRHRAREGRPGRRHRRRPAEPGRRRPRSRPRKAAGRAEGGAAASDAFYPFPDGLEAAAAAGAAVVVQPGGVDARRRS